MLFTFSREQLKYCSFLLSIHFDPISDLILMNPYFLIIVLYYVVSLPMSGLVTQQYMIMGHQQNLVSVFAFFTKIHHPAQTTWNCF